MANVRVSGAGLPPTTKAEALKLLMPRIPKPVCVVTFQSIHGTLHGLTATSVRFGPAGILVFNVQKESKAHLGLEGLAGSLVAVHLVSRKQKGVVEALSKDTELEVESFREATGLELRVEEEDMPPLFEALCVPLARVTRIEEVGDHSVVVAQVERSASLGWNMAMCRDELLIYHHRRYCSLAEAMGSPRPTIGYP